MAWNRPAAFALALAAAGLAAILVRAPAVPPPVTVACPGQTFPMGHAASGSSPYVVLSAGGETGPFLLDTGATTSSMARHGFPASSGTVTVTGLTLPGFPSGRFALRDYPPGIGPPGGQLGIIGTDFLASMGVELTYGPGGDTVTLSGSPCDGSMLAARGFVALSQRGYYSANPQPSDPLPNVPVVFVDIAGVTVAAQVDSGYDDIRWPHSIDINEALFQRLTAAGIELEALGPTLIGTCSGTETRTVYRLARGAVAVETADQTPVAGLDDVHLIRKPPGSCGGISDFTVPWAQIGASSLRTLSGIVIDGTSQLVWIKKP